MAFDSAPPEILDAILSLLDRSALKTIRRVNKLLARRLAPLLFSNLEIWIQAKSLARLVSIANHNTLSQYVQNLTITNDFVTTCIIAPADLISAINSKVTSFVERGTRRPIKGLSLKDANSINLEGFIKLGYSHPATKSISPEKLQDLGWPRERLFSAWKLQRDIAIKQAESLSSNSDVEALTISLKRFKNLSSIRLSSNGIGGPSKLRANGMQDYFSREETSRADGRQLSILMLAAAAAVTDPLSSTLFKPAIVTSFIVNKEFWDKDEKTYTNRSLYQQPDFGTIIQLATLRSAIPFFANLTTLTLSVHNNGEGNVEVNLACFLAALSKLEHLTLYNPETPLLLLNQSLSSIATRLLTTLELQCCVLCLGDMQNLFEANSTTLSSIQIENVSLLNGRFVDFFLSLRNLPKLDIFGLNGWIIEAENDQDIYFDRERDEDRIYQNKERRYLARGAIIDFVLHRREEFPTELLDTSSPLCYNMGFQGMNVLIGAWMFPGSRFEDINKPKVAVQVGEIGDKGVIEIQNMMFTVTGATAGAIVVQWNVHESSKGSAAMWDTHIRVGGAIGSKLQKAQCPKLTGTVNKKYMAASLLLHLTKESSAYLENVWAWVADYDLDVPSQDQIDIYVGRGILVESQGPTWMYGTASEHCILYQYQFSGAKNVLLGMIQTEAPW